MSDGPFALNNEIKAAAFTAWFGSRGSHFVRSAPKSTPRIVFAQWTTVDSECVVRVRLQAGDNLSPCFVVIALCHDRLVLKDHQHQ
jgi:hypothetical protein